MYFDYSFPFLNLLQYSPNYSLSVNNWATISATIIVKEKSMQRMAQESTWSMYFICRPAEKERLNRLNIINDSSTSFKRYLDTLWRNTAFGYESS